MYKLLLHFENWEKADNPVGWLFGTARLLARGHARDERRKDRLSREIRPKWRTSDPVFVKALGKPTLAEMAKLSPAQRIATYLRHVEGWSAAAARSASVLPVEAHWFRRPVWLRPSKPKSFAQKSFGQPGQPAGSVPAR